MFFFNAGLVFSQFIPSTTSSTDNIFRTGSVSVGYTALPSFANNYKFNVQGKSLFDGPINIVNSDNDLNKNSITFWGETNQSVSSQFVLAMATCDGCNSQVSQKGDAIIRAMSPGSLLLSNDKNGDIKFVTRETTTDQVRMLIDKYGKVGIGTNTPDYELQVVGGLEANQGIFTSDLPDGSFFQPGERNDLCTVFAAGSKIGSGPGYINTRMVNIFDFPASNNNPQSTIWFNIVDRGDMDRFRMFASTGGATNFIMYNRSQQEIFRVYEDGNDNVSVQLAKPNSFLGIGTTSATDGTDTFNLSVKGKMRAEEVKVYTTWADYVFNDDYQLPSLDEVENHIKEKGHLINMPSGQDIEEKGLFVGEITKIQQEKIEELTLYLIQQKKEIDELKLQVKLLLEKSKE